MLGLLACLGLSAVAFIQCSVAEKGEKHSFAAEVTQVMDMIIHSLYKSKEIFLRELISNASDALGKLRHLALTDKSLAPNDWEYKITVKADPVKRTLTITDTGIGMSKEELKTKLGTIALSGTKEFIARVKEQGGSDISSQIGQFGVGFYSSFLAGNLIQVISKTSNGEKFVWECDISSGVFTLEQCPEEIDSDEPISVQGTKVIIHLNPVNEDNEDYTKEDLLKDLIHRYSEFIDFPIRLFTRKNVTSEEPLSEEELAAQAAEEVAADKEKEEAQSEGGDKDKESPSKKLKVEDASEGEDDTDSEKKEKTKAEKKTTKSVTREVCEYALVNENKPVYDMEPSDVTDDQHDAFYMAAYKDTSKPLAKTHFKVESVSKDGANFKGLLYVPEKPHFQLLSNDQPTDVLRLYVKRVFITSEFPDFPRYMSFVRATVNADEMRLNVSRETLQKSTVVKEIKNRVLSKTLSMLNTMSKNETLYDSFYRTYSNHLKLGVISEVDNEPRKKELAGLLRFHSSLMADKNMTSFDGYMERMKPNQTDIYFVSGGDVASLKGLPYAKSLLKRGIEVLFMTDTYDEYMVQALPKYKEMTLKNVAKGGIKFDHDDPEAEKKKLEDNTTRFKPLTDTLLRLFGKRIEKVVIGELDTSPMAIVANTFGWSPAMERLMKSNAAASGGKDDPMAAFFGRQKKILEINPEHPLIIGLLEKLNASAAAPAAEGKDADVDAALIATAASSKKAFEKDLKLLYDAALLHSGYELKNPAAFATRVEDMLRNKYHVEPLAPETVKAAEEADNEEGLFGGGGGAGGGFGGGPGGMDMSDMDMSGMDMSGMDFKMPDMDNQLDSDASDHHHDHDHDHDLSGSEEHGDHPLSTEEKPLANDPVAPAELEKDEL